MSTWSFRVVWIDGSETRYIFSSKSVRDAMHRELCGVLRRYEMKWRPFRARVVSVIHSEGVVETIRLGQIRRIVKSVAG